MNGTQKLIRRKADIKCPCPHVPRHAETGQSLPLPPYGHHVAFLTRLATQRLSRDSRFYLIAITWPTPRGSRPHRDGTDPPVPPGQPSPRVSSQPRMGLNHLHVPIFSLNVQHVPIFSLAVKTKLPRSDST